MRNAMLMFFLTLGIGLQAQSKSQVFDAIRKVDVAALNLLFDQNIEYCFDDQIQFMEKTVAIKALKAFLDRNLPRSITPIHKGTSKGEDSNFAIAIMETAEGKKFRIYVYAENSGGKLLVQELRIDRQN